MTHDAIQLFAKQAIALNKPENICPENNDFYVGIIPIVLTDSEIAAFTKQANAELKESRIRIVGNTKNSSGKVVAFICKPV